MEATLNEITRVVDEQIRPRLQAHGGDLSIISFEEGILRIKLHGACSTCPSAQLTMEETVKAALDGLVEDVFVVTTINDDLLNYAKTILNTHKP
ncbi:MAG: NifU family protein [Bacteroidales bacterium]|nr:NifU family protein [Bacteroidales bacterium]